MRCFMFFFLSLVSSFAVGEIVHVPASSDAISFRSDERLVFNHPVISGALKYQDHESEEYSEGYYKTNVVEFSGSRSRYLFDYSEKYTVEYLMAAIRSSLSRQGFKVSYQCEAANCGESEGYSSFLSNLVDTNTSSYGYQLFTRDKNDENLVSVYVALIDRQVRVLFDVYHTRPTSILIDLEQEATLEQGNAGLMLFYNTSQTTMSERNRSLLTNFIQLNLQGLEDSYLLVRGHSDDIGGDALNKKVSKERAGNVIDYLKSNYSIDTCPAQYYGSSDPMISSVAETGEFSNRRVEITLVQSEAFCE